MSYKWVRFSANSLLISFSVFFEGFYHLVDLICCCYERKGNSSPTASGIPQKILLSDLVTFRTTQKFFAMSYKWVRFSANSLLLSFSVFFEGFYPFILPMVSVFDGILHFTSINCCFIFGVRGQHVVVAFRLGL